ncbi:MAG: N-acetylmuramoyl-L-alanine amidase, partial [Pacificimonas sp.]
LQRFGYEARNLKAAVRAFQLRWRPERHDGEIDVETRAILFQLLKANTPEDFILGNALPRV